jgi:EAL domain-containing protein (putative c-di-GMP-specific phosphodiesterase class I)
MSTAPADRTPHAAGDLVSAALLDIRSVYQPVVDLGTGEVVGYEALARGPQGTPWEAPRELFARARELGVVGDIDWACRAAAYRGALSGRLPASLPLMVNVEPGYLAATPPAAVERVVALAEQRLQVVFEITERDLVADPAGLLRAVRQARRAGHGIALDDVGAVPGSLALMPFVEPDVIKLDLTLVQGGSTADVGGVVNAVTAQAERSGAVVLAEGIETAEHRQRALAMGATLGQGWLLGRPEPLPKHLARPRLAEVAFTRVTRTIPRTPFSVVEGQPSVRIAPKSMLVPLTAHLEGQALASAEPPVLLAAFSHADQFTVATARRYTELAGRCAFVAALGAGLPAEPAPGVRGAGLAADDPLAGEWVVALVGPHYTGALIARDLGDTDRDDADRRFAFTVTHDRATVLRAASALLERVTPAVSRPG